MAKSKNVCTETATKYLASPFLLSSFNSKAATTTNVVVVHRSPICQQSISFNIIKLSKKRSQQTTFKRQSIQSKSLPFKTTAAAAAAKVCLIFLAILAHKKLYKKRNWQKQTNKQTV